MLENTTSNLDLTIFSNDELRQLIEQAQAVLAEREASEATPQPERRMVKVEGIKVCLDKTGKFAMAITPYHPDLVKEFRALNGKWQAGNASWVFDARDIERVREMVTETFGTDGKEPVEVVDVAMVLVGSATNDKSRFALGREIVARVARDSRVKLGDGVTVISGSFTGSGGSRNNPAIMRYGEEPVTVLVRDVPMVLAQEAVESDSEIYRIVA
jgi:hypothetical protein